MIQQAIFGSDTPKPYARRFADDNSIPNSRHPVLIYRANAADQDGLANRLEQLFASHGWPPQWRGGVFDYHHYHSNAHEVLGVASGTAMLMLGGEQGETVDIAPGDVVILPAGTGHCRIQASVNFELVAAYPPDQQDWDLCRPGQVDLGAARDRIATLTVPEQDPVAGAEGALVSLWR
ncbi:double-stranded beta helix domain-containing protein [Salinisphaera dokdonensis CL-ES53]|uniref:Double-stranded beta helix domain-containing protein n=1 Tax=Salinisphaera dokdonensis CL-ES53 TaxID=1304272 RepID=A0ABV2AZW4_9GAMM